MKNMFKQHTIAKLLGIIIFVAIILTWIIPVGGFNGVEFIKSETVKVGLSDIPTIAYNSIYYAIDKIVYLLVLGGFYAVISKTKGYKKFVSNISQKIKGKETIFVLAVSVILAVLTSFTTSTFAMLLFVPLLITIMLNSGMSKLTSFAATFGAILVGILGATYGTEILKFFAQYYNQVAPDKDVLKLTLSYRIIILVISMILYNFFLYFAVKKSLDKKSKEEIPAEFEVEEVKDKKTKVYPVAIIFGLLFVIFILGFVDWNGIFKITAFDDFHNWLLDYTVGDKTKIFSYILGSTSTAFGRFDLFTLSTVVAIFTIFTAILCSVKFDDLLTNFGEGALNLVKPIAGMVAVYSVFIIVYMSPIVPTVVNSIMKKDGTPDINIDYKGTDVAVFNVDTDNDGKADLNFVNTDVDKDGKCDFNCDTNKDGFPDEKLDFNGNKEIDDYDKAYQAQMGGQESLLDYDTDGDGIADVNIVKDKNIFKMITAAAFTGTFQVDIGYTGYSLSQFLVNSYGAFAYTLVFMIFVGVYALLQFFIPTSIILVLGLLYTKVNYKDWMKHIWRFILGMLCVLLIIFIFMAIV